MEHHPNVPEEWWYEACSRIDYPLACVGRDNKFLWINDAWCRLTGYSPAELRTKTWQDITVIEDVGSDLSAVQEVIDGKRDSYYSEKHYVRRDNTTIPVGLTVHRFPITATEPLICFIAEAVNKSYDHTVQRLKADVEILKAAINELNKHRIEEESEDLVFDILIPYLRKHWGVIVFFGTIIGSMITGVVWLINQIR